MSDYQSYLRKNVPLLRPIDDSSNKERRAQLFGNPFKLPERRGGQDERDKEPIISEDQIELGIKRRDEIKKKKYFGTLFQQPYVSFFSFRSFRVYINLKCYYKTAIVRITIYFFFF